MKKLWIIAAVMGIISGCGGNGQNAKIRAAAQNEPDTIIISGDGHTAQNSLDYEGTYTGKLPTASGMGMNVTITLKNGAFVKTTEYVGKQGVFEDKGKFSWDAGGFIITLNGITDAPNKYFVSEGRIFQLDMNGNWITERFDDKYALHKQ